MGLFSRMTVEGRRLDAYLEESCAGPLPSVCWLVGGGPSLAEAPCDAIAATPAARMAVNLAGMGLLRPTHWTSYDPTIRFQRSVYLDPGIAKFVHRRRANDVVPETTYKVCECPQVYFFERDGDRDFHQFLRPGASGIVDWADSWVQAIDIAYRLGFRTLYAVGCDMRVAPTAEQWAVAREAGLEVDEAWGLSELVARCRPQPALLERLKEAAPARQYHFDEAKAFDAAVATDAHYFRVTQFLRLSRRAMHGAGVTLVSATPGSRLNDYFAFADATHLCEALQAERGDAAEAGRGWYTQQVIRSLPAWSRMKDVKPPRHEMAKGEAPMAAACGGPELIVEREGAVAARVGWSAHAGVPMEVG